jgi:uncharacterized protein (DUF2336 family)
MSVGVFLLWLETASVDARSDAAIMIAASFTPAMPLEERCAAEASLAVLLDDPSPVVRQALAERLSLTAAAPRQALHALALDQIEVAAPILVRSRLDEATLVEAARKGGREAAVYVADRANLPAGVCREIALHGNLEACLVLVANTTAHLDEEAFSVIVDRHRDAPELRGMLLRDRRATLQLRQRLVDAACDALCSAPLVARLLGEVRASELARETAASAVVELVDTAHIDDLGPYVCSLRDAGRMTTGLVLKALVTGRIDFVATVLCELSGRNEAQVRSILIHGGERALDALLGEIGFTGLMRRLAVKALVTWRDVAAGRRVIGRQELAWNLLVEAKGSPASHCNDGLISELRRIYLEAARDNARLQASELREEARIEETAANIALSTLEFDFAALSIALEQQPDARSGAFAVTAGHSPEAARPAFDDGLPRFIELPFVVQRDPAPTAIHENAREQDNETAETAAALAADAETAFDAVFELPMDDIRQDVSHIELVELLMGSPDDWRREIKSRNDDRFDSMSFEAWFAAGSAPGLDAADRSRFEVAA